MVVEFENILVFFVSFQVGYIKKDQDIEQLMIFS